MSERMGETRSDLLKKMKASEANLLAAIKLYEYKYGMTETAREYVSKIEENLQKLIWELSWW